MFPIHMAILSIGHPCYAATISENTLRYIMFNLTPTSSHHPHPWMHACTQVNITTISQQHHHQYCCWAEDADRPSRRPPNVIWSRRYYRSALIKSDPWPCPTWKRPATHGAPDAYVTQGEMAFFFKSSY